MHWRVVWGSTEIVDSYNATMATQGNKVIESDKLLNETEAGCCEGNRMYKQLTQTKKRYQDSRKVQNAWYIYV